MKFEFGDVVMFLDKAYFVIDFDSHINLLCLTDGVIMTSDIDCEEVVKIGHDDTFGQDIVDRLKSIVNIHNEELRGNQLELISYIAANRFCKEGVSYLVTGNTKIDGNDLCCQIQSDNGDEWILMEELLDKFFR